VLPDAVQRTVAAQRDQRGARTLRHQMSRCLARVAAAGKRRRLGFIRHDDVDQRQQVAPDRTRRRRIEYDEPPSGACGADHVRGRGLRSLVLQEHGPRTWQVALQRAHLGRDATLRSSVVALGGAYARLRSESLLAGSGAESDLTAVYFGDGDQMLDFRTLQDHDAPNTRSDLLFKGAVEDTAQSVYSGLIRIRRNAQKSVAFQTNRNLVLTEGAEAKSVPTSRSKGRRREVLARQHRRSGRRRPALLPRHTVACRRRKRSGLVVLASSTTCSTASRAVPLHRCDAA
jgi:hypothetical protein